MKFGWGIPLPKEATVLTHLTYLSFFSTKLNDQEFLRFTNLKNLSFTCKSKVLHFFTNLESLNLRYGSTLTNEVECWKSLSKLTSLHVFCNATSLSYLTNLETLELTHDLGIEKSLSTLTKLTTLRLANGMTGKYLKFFTNLKSLTLATHTIHPKCFPYLTNLVHLATLCPISNDQLKQLTNLEELLLNSSHLITDEGISRLTKLRSLQIGSNETITKNIFSKLSHSLNYLDIFDKKNISSQDLLVLTNLTTLLCSKEQFPKEEFTTLTYLRDVTTFNHFGRQEKTELLDTAYLPPKKK